MPFDMFILPRSDPGTTDVVIRTMRHCSVRLYTVTPDVTGLPYGPLPRLILAWIWYQAQRGPVVEFGSAFRRFVARCGAGSPDAHFADQLDRLVRCSVCVDRAIPQCEGYIGPESSEYALMGKKVVSLTGPCPNWTEAIEIQGDTFGLMARLAFVVDADVLRALHPCCFALDLYLWLAHTCFSHHDPFTVPWRRVYEVFAEQPAPAPTPEALDSFRAHTLRGLATVQAAWPALQYYSARETLTVSPVPFDTVRRKKKTKRGRLPSSRPALPRLEDSYGRGS